MSSTNGKKRRVDWPRRILTVIVGIPTALKLLSSDVGMLLLASTLCGLSLWEFETTICKRIVSTTSSNSAFTSFWHSLVVVFAGIVVCGASWTGKKVVCDAVMMATTLGIILLHFLRTKKLDQRAMTSLLLDLFALSYIVNGFSHAILLRYTVQYGFGMQILGLSCAWVCDTGALIAGSFFGHTKLAPVISPGKTVEGAVAGLVSSIMTVLVMFSLSHVLPYAHELLPSTEIVPITHQVVLGLVVGVLCILGDLIESYMKRMANVKDSGSFFPGHGGCLDRMDSFLFVAPFLYFYSCFAVPLDTL